MRVDRRTTGRITLLATRLVAGLGLVFLIFPILFLVPLSFSGSAKLAYPIEAFSLRWYALILEPHPWLDALWNSVLVASATTFLATALGTAAAYGLQGMSARLGVAISALLVAPMVVPTIIVALATYFMLARFQLIGTFAGLVIGHSVIAVPFVIIMVTVSLRNFDRDLVRCALSLGARPLMTFFTITLPLIWPGVAAGAILAFLASFDEIVIAVFISGPNFFTLPRQLFTTLEYQLDPSIIAVSTVLVAISAFLLSLVETLRRGRN